MIKILTWPSEQFLDTEDSSQANGFIRVGSVQTFSHTSYEVLFAFYIKSLKGSLLLLLLCLLLPILFEAFTLSTLPGSPSQMKTFPSTAFRVSVLGSFMVL